MIGTPATIADQMEEWLETDGCDGFNVMFPYLPGGLDDFVDRVVPELQRRGLFRREYEGVTLRENLGLPRPENRFFKSEPGLAPQRRAASGKDMTAPAPEFLFDTGRGDSMADIRVICAIGKRGQLGLKGHMPWEGNRDREFIEDVERFFEITRGHVILCGPRTAASVPKWALAERTVAILCYNDEDVVFSWSKAEDDAVMAKLAVVHQKLARRASSAPPRG